MQETLRVAPFGTLKLKEPSAFVTVPIRVLPTTITEAPTMGSPDASTTVPLMERFWACSPATPRNPKIKTKMVFNSFCLILFGLMVKSY